MITVGGLSCQRSNFSPSKGCVFVEPNESFVIMNLYIYQTDINEDSKI